MGHPFRVRDIALQAGLSPTTVDRVLHRRPGVRESTVAEVEQAIADLQRQKDQLRLGGRTFVVDVVMDSPAKFAAQVKGALEAELPGLHPAILRSRFHFTRAAPDATLVASLEAIAARGSHGVILKAPDTPDLVHAVDRVVSAGIPVVTLVSDLPTSRRVAYVGLDNRAAGATAGYLLEKILSPGAGTVLVTRGDGTFRGDDEREMGFRGAMRQLGSSRQHVFLVNAAGPDDVLQQMVERALAADLSINAVYSMYTFGGNEAVLAGFAAAGRPCAAFLAHDLDQSNQTLLEQGLITAVLHHDLRTDMRRACQIIMRAGGALPGEPRSAHSSVQIVTPSNLPTEY